MAAEALRGIGDSSVLGALEALADDRFGSLDDTFDMKVIGRVAFGVWWQIQTPKMNETEKLALLAGALRLAEPVGSPWGDAACDLLEKQGEKAVPPLMPLLKGNDRRSKIWAMRTLKDIVGKDDVEALRNVALKDVESDDRLLRSIAMGVLVRHPEKPCLPTLVRVLARSHEPYMRARAVIAIGHIDDKSVDAVLTKALSDRQEWVRTQAAAELARRGLRHGDEILLASLGSRSGGERRIALRAIPHIKDQRRVRERLLEILGPQPDEGKLTEQNRVLLRGLRHNVLRELATWDAARLRPIGPALERLFLGKPLTGWARTILKKLDEPVE